MVAFSKNTRRSASSIGLPCNITYPAPDGIVSAGNSDGSDFRHVGDIYRRRFRYSLITVNVGANFGLNLDVSLSFNLTKTISVGLNTELDLSFRYITAKSVVVGLETNLDLQISFTKSMTTETAFGTNLAFQFKSQDIIIDTNPSTFCFTAYVMQELDLTGYINQELDLVGYLKNRC